MWSDVCMVLDQNSGIGFGGADFSSTVQEGFEPRTWAYVVLCEAQVEVGLPRYQVIRPRCKRFNRLNCGAMI